MPSATNIARLPARGTVSIHAGGGGILAVVADFSRLPNCGFFST
jgi:hypothetical protein